MVKALCSCKNGAVRNETFFGGNWLVKNALTHTYVHIKEI